ncbi:MAG: MBL fold metallo-hydrolase [Thermoplasmata archaeon]|nr:MAG: MBL fold metallo-hydrolase [Thermoplasmata archaeon]
MPHLRMVVLGSSSSGNATLVEADGASLLVDAGFSCKEVTRRMSAVGADPRDLQAIVVTHEHTDHMRGVSVLARRHGLPVFATPGTVRAASRYLGDVDLRPMGSGEAFDHGSFSITLVPIPHDATEPAAVRLEAGGRRVLVATDIGQFPWALVESAQDMDAMVLESNHDERMLRTGPYPEFLKKRIRGPKGHLSNSESAVALRALMGPRTRAVLLGHLSQKNNTEELALRTVLARVPEPVRREVDIRTTAPDRSESVEI